MTFSPNQKAQPPVSGSLVSKDGCKQVVLRYWVHPPAVVYFGRTSCQGPCQPCVSFRCFISQCQLMLLPLLPGVLFLKPLDLAQGVCAYNTAALGEDPVVENSMAGLGPVSSQPLSLKGWCGHLLWAQGLTEWLQLSPLGLTISFCWWDGLEKLLVYSQ